MVSQNSITGTRKNRRKAGRPSHIEQGLEVLDLFSTSPINWESWVFEQSPGGPFSSQKV